MTARVWTLADMAKELGVTCGRLYHWHVRYRDGEDYPEPVAVTGSGMPLWTCPDADRILARWRAHQQGLADRRAKGTLAPAVKPRAPIVKTAEQVEDEARAARALEWLLAA